MPVAAPSSASARLIRDRCEALAADRRYSFPVRPVRFRRRSDRAPSLKCSLNLPRVPLAPSLRGYRAAWLRSDVAAGLAIAAVGLPSAIAYPAIAGLPPETGLYASIAPLVAYAIFGPSRQLIVGPDAATMTVLAARPDRGARRHARRDRPRRRRRDAGAGRRRRSTCWRGCCGSACSRPSCRGRSSPASSPASRSRS